MKPEKGLSHPPVLLTGMESTRVVMKARRAEGMPLRFHPDPSALLRAPDESPKDERVPMSYEEIVRRLAYFWETGSAMEPLYRLAAQKFDVPVWRVQDDVLNEINR